MQVPSLATMFACLCLPVLVRRQIIWRFFRLWAALDGIDTIENMARCMSNNYSISGASSWCVDNSLRLCVPTQSHC
jgi:hypothetical protein